MSRATKVVGGGVYLEDGVGIRRRYPELTIVADGDTRGLGGGEIQLTDDLSALDHQHLIVGGEGKEALTDLCHTQLLGLARTWDGDEATISRATVDPIAVGAQIDLVAQDSDVRRPLLCEGVVVVDLDLLEELLRAMVRRPSPPFLGPFCEMI